MTRRAFPLVFALSAAALAAASVCVPMASTQEKTVPKLEPIAETKLLMEGLALANFRGLERHLTARPTEEQTWIFARGQALLIAETANLLMLRPPKKEGQALWFARAIELRVRATQLAKTVAAKDWEGSRRQLVELGATCTQCHKSFRVPILIEPFAEPAPKAE
jgi:hypothetical protein